MVARLIGVNAPSAAQLARETGISAQNLSRWLSGARNPPFVAQGGSVVSSRNAEQKARIIAQAAQLDGKTLTAYLRQEGVKPSHFRNWRFALEEAGDESLGITQRIRTLERQWVRKKRVLAEAAALPVLREPVEFIIERERQNVDRRGEEKQESDC
jgi:transcriptional regulator with XRE-family HTH domain